MFVIPAAIGFVVVFTLLAIIRRIGFLAVIFGGIAIACAAGHHGWWALGAGLLAIACRPRL